MHVYKHQPYLRRREDVLDRPLAQVKAASQRSLKNETMGMKKPRQNAKHTYKGAVTTINNTLIKVQETLNSNINGRTRSSYSNTTTTNMEK